MDDSASDTSAPTAEGTFADTPLPHLLVHALNQQLTGTFELAFRGSPEGVLLVIDGQPAKARTMVDHYLVRVMQQVGVMTEAQVHNWLPRLLMSEELHGKALVRQKVLTEEQVETGLRAQLVRQMQTIVELPAEATWRYFDGIDALAGWGEDTDIRLDPYPFVWSSLRLQPPWDHVNTGLATLADAAIRLPHDAETTRFGFDKGQRATVELLRRKAWLFDDLLKAAAMPPETVKLLVYCLMLVKVIDILPADEAGRVAARPPVAPPAEVARPARPDPRAEPVSEPLAHVEVDPSAGDRETYVPDESIASVRPSLAIIPPAREPTVARAAAQAPIQPKAAPPPTPIAAPAPAPAPEPPEPPPPSAPPTPAVLVAAEPMSASLVDVPKPSLMGPMTPRVEEPPPSGALPTPRGIGPAHGPPSSGRPTPRGLNAVRLMEDVRASSDAPDDKAASAGANSPAAPAGPRAPHGRSKDPATFVPLTPLPPPPEAIPPASERLNPTKPPPPDLEEPGFDVTLASPVPAVPAAGDEVFTRSTAVSMAAVTPEQVAAYKATQEKAKALPAVQVKPPVPPRPTLASMFGGRALPAPPPINRNARLLSPVARPPGATPMTFNPMSLDSSRSAIVPPEPALQPAAAQVTPAPGSASPLVPATASNPVDITEKPTASERVSPLPYSSRKTLEIPVDKALVDATVAAASTRPTVEMLPETPVTPPPPAPAAPAPPPPPAPQAPVVPNASASRPALELDIDSPFDAGWDD